MNKLDELLTIVERTERQNALAKYARSIGVDVEQARDQIGDINEEKIVLLIFDAHRKKKQSRKSDYRFIGVGLALAAIVILLIGIAPQMMASFYQGQVEEEKRDKVMLQGYTKEGKPAYQDGEPVMFKSMEGVYEQYDKQGNLVEEHHYKRGHLIKKKRFNRKGQVIFEKDFPLE